MLSIKRLLQLIAITVFIGVAFLILTIDHNTSNFEGKNIYSGIKLELLSNKIPPNVNNENYLVVSNSKDKSEIAISKNIIDTLNSMKKSVNLSRSITQKDLTSKPIIIFAVAQVSRCVEMGLISNYISAGGRVLFAAGIPEGYLDSYLDPVWGIIEKGNRIAVNNFEIASGFLPYPAVTADFKGGNSSTIIKLGVNTKIYMKSSDQLPLVYSSTFNNVKTVIINGTLLQEKYSSGIFCAALGVLNDDMIYPTIGTKSIFLDAFPPIANVNDTRSSELYGRSTEAFLRDILWPELLANLTQHDLKYTATILSVLPESYDINTINKRLFTYAFREIISRKGEVIMAGDHSKENNFDITQLDKAQAFVKSVFKNYVINGYAVLYGNPNEKVLNSVTTEFDGAKIINGVLNGDPKTQLTHDFGADAQYVYVPTASNGFSIKNGTNFDFLSILTSKGVVSHSFNIESLLKASFSNTSWDDVKIDYEELDTKFFEKTPWLKPATISEAANNVKAYSALKMSILNSQSEIDVYCDNFMKNQTFYLRSEKQIKQITGAKYTKISDVYYQVTAETPNFSIIFK